MTWEWSKAFKWCFLINSFAIWRKMFRPSVVNVQQHRILFFQKSQKITASLSNMFFTVAVPFATTLVLRRRLLQEGQRLNLFRHGRMKWPRSRDVLTPHHHHSSAPPVDDRLAQNSRCGQDEMSILVKTKPRSLFIWRDLLATSDHSVSVLGHNYTPTFHHLHSALTEVRTRTMSINYIKQLRLKDHLCL